MPVVLSPLTVENPYICTVKQVTLMKSNILVSIFTKAESISVCRAATHILLLLMGTQSESVLLFCRYVLKGTYAAYACMEIWYFAA